MKKLFVLILTLVSMNCFGQWIGQNKQWEHLKPQMFDSTVIINDSLKVLGVFSLEFGNTLSLIDSDKIILAGDTIDFYTNTIFRVINLSTGQRVVMDSNGVGVEWTIDSFTYKSDVYWDGVFEPFIEQTITANGRGDIASNLIKLNQGEAESHIQLWNGDSLIHVIHTAVGDTIINTTNAGNRKFVPPLTDLVGQGWTIDPGEPSSMSAGDGAWSPTGTGLVGNTIAGYQAGINLSFPGASGNQNTLYGFQVDIIDSTITQATGIGTAILVGNSCVALGSGITTTADNQFWVGSGINVWLPYGDSTTSLGDATHRFTDVWVANSSLHIGSETINATGSTAGTVPISNGNTTSYNPVSTVLASLPTYAIAGFPANAQGDGLSGKYVTITGVTVGLLTLDMVVKVP